MAHILKCVAGSGTRNFVDRLRKGKNTYKIPVSLNRHKIFERKRVDTYRDVFKRPWGAPKYVVGSGTQNLANIFFKNK